MAAKKPIHLPGLGVYGFDATEPVILAALVTEDPLMLIGASGTGKTFLLNSLSEALGLEHRHYNASLISFDDLVGFPYPDQDNGSVRFLETPATVWSAESVLIDEISRCKPEHQNRLFSLVHERRVQGIPLPKLRFRWAAMNPCTSDQSSSEDYSGSEPLDPALADRFGLFVQAVDWDGLSEEARKLISAPGGEGRIASDGGVLRKAIAAWRKDFQKQVDTCPEEIIVYATAAVSALNNAKVRISPRRSRLLARSLLAVTIITRSSVEKHFRQVLECSLPHACWGVAISREVVAAAHRVAWDSAVATEKRWLHAFMAEHSLVRKLEILLDKCTSNDAGSQAVAQLLAAEPRSRAATFAFVVYPAAAQGRLSIGAEGINDLGKIATPLYTASGEIQWQERQSASGTRHPDFVRYAAALNGLKGGRAERAKQFFNACLVADITLDHPKDIEGEIDACVSLLTGRGLA